MWQQIVVGLFLCQYIDVVVGRSVEVNLTTAWPSSVGYPLLETSEFLAQEDKLYFWDFVDQMAQQEITYDWDHVSPISLIPSVLKHATSILPPDSLVNQVLQLVLSTRAMSPAVEMYRQLARESKEQTCGEDVTAWAIVYKSKDCPEAVACNLEQLKAALEAQEQNTSGEKQTCAAAASHDYAMAFDHVVTRSAHAHQELRTVILYGMLGTTDFNIMHQYVWKLVQQGRDLKYVLRHAPQGPMIPTSAQGFGVVLDVKNMEYKTIDDSKDGKIKSSEEDQVKLDKEEKDEEYLYSILTKKDDDLREKLKKLDPKETYQLDDIGLNAVIDIMGVADPLGRMEELSQNFPKYAKALYRTNHKGTTESVRTEVQDNTRIITQILQKRNQVFLNGIAIDAEDDKFNAFDVLRSLRKEMGLISRFEKLDIPAGQRKALIAIANHLSSEGATVRIDLFDSDSASTSGYGPFYINDIESKEYKGMFPKTVDTLLRPSWNLRLLQKNMYNIVLIVDPLTSTGIGGLKQMMFLHGRRAPLRMGTLFTSPELLSALREAKSQVEAPELSAKYFVENFPVASPLESLDIDSEKATVWYICKLLGSLRHKKNAIKTFERVREFFSNLISAKEHAEEMVVRDLVEAYVTVFNSDAEGHASKALDILQGSKYDDFAFEMNLFCFEKGINQPDVHFFNGMFIDGTQLQKDLIQRIQKEEETYQKLVQEGIIDDESDMIADLLSYESNVYSMMIPDLEKVSSPKEGNEEEGTQQESKQTASFIEFSSIEAIETMKKIRYLHPRESISMVKSLTATIVADLNQKNGLQLASSTLRYLIAQEKRSDSFDNQLVRLAIVHNPIEQTQSKGDLISAALYEIGNSDNPEKVQALLKLIELAHKAKTFNDLQQAYTDNNLSEILPLDATKGSERELELQSIGDLFRVKPGATGFFLNAREVALAPDSSVGTTDQAYDILIHREVSSLSKKILKALKLTKKGMKKPQSSKAKGRELSDIIMAASSAVGEYSGIPRVSLDTIEEDASFETKMTRFTVEGNTPNVEIIAYLDPLTAATQRITPLLRVINEKLGASVKVTLLPTLEHSQFPLHSFYRFVFGTTSIQELEKGILPKAKFEALPLFPILTLKMETPESWNVEMLKTTLDLDNLRVDRSNSDEVNGVSEAEFQLQSLLATGNCYDYLTPGNRPPNGLKLTLHRGHGDSRQYRDTLVMQNLGYYQLKAAPGIWTLELAKGRARDLYEILDEEELRRGKREIIQSKQYVIRDFDTEVHPLVVKKRKGKENEELLETEGNTGFVDNAEDEDTEAESESLWSSMSSFFSSSKDLGEKDVNKVKRKGETIHVFSVATGHLYERFLKIMMLSVLKRTSNPVKFWLLSNFLSPAFKDSIAKLQAEFGMEIELVTYKWPRWLRQQTEKQRIIWGYKILFLDVLFPLRLKKIIYVDADQVVRADLKELWTMDLQGRAYGYTPFCSSRKETLGFQFWRSGYWKDHLQGKPYHISALYVVDLVKFRRIAAGDRLRAIYAQLSRDANSLANLDQDLPNFAQHHLPIFSLPEEWLWCESWCSDKSKTKAKTIDLCNNPLHKEPKLDMAKRVISGELFPESWLELDAEIRQAEERQALAIETTARDEL